MLREVLQYDTTLDGAIQRMKNKHRTCDLILGVGDGKDQLFNSVEYSYSVCDIMDDTNMRPVASWHPTLKNVVYHGMDWLCPGYNQVLFNQLNKYHGTLTPELAIQNVMPIAQTGDLHVYVADLVNMKIWISVAATSTGQAPKMAYDRAYIKLDLTSIFTLAPPL